MKLLVALALLVLIVALVLAGIVSLLAGGKAGLTSGAVLIGLCLLLVVALFIGLMWLKRKLKAAFQGLANATQAAAAGALPEVITLQPVRLAEEGIDLRALEARSKELERLGYQGIGEFKIPEMSVKPYLRAFLNQATNTYAVVYYAEAVSKDPWVDIVTRFGECNGLTTTTAALAGLLNKPPKVRTQKFPNASMSELVAKHNERVSQIVSEEEAPPIAMSADGFVDCFLTAYHEERLFREAQGGPTEEEVRRVAEATPGAETTSEEVIALTTNVMRDAQKGEGSGEIEHVPSPDFTGAAAEPGFQKIILEIAKLCGCQPEPFGQAPGGVVFQVDQKLAENVLDRWHTHYLERGCYLYRSEQNFGAGGTRDELALLPTSNRDDVIRAMETDGCNCEVYTEDIIRWLNDLETSQPFLLTGIGADFLEGKFASAVQDPEGLAKRMYEFCPDIVDQGVGSVEELATELRNNQKLYFWWD